MTIYSRVSCPPCQSLKKFLTHKGIEYVEKSVDIEENLKEMLELTGVQIVPTTVKGDRYVVGLNYSAVLAML